MQKTHLYRVVNPGRWLLEPETDEKFERSIMTPQQVGLLSQLGPFDADEGVWRLGRGDVCYLVFIDGRLAHYSWVQRQGLHTITEARATILVKPGDFWVYHCRTAENARGRGIYPGTLDYLIYDHFKGSFNQGWIYTSRSNLSSQKGILKANFSQVSTLSALRFGPRYFCGGKRNLLKLDEAFSSGR